MKIQASVIQVNRTTDRQPAVTDTLFCMEEARRILIDPDSGTYQTGIVGASQLIDDRLVGNSRRNNPHINPRLAASSSSLPNSSLMIRYGVVK